MDIVGLISGGKDSVYNLQLAAQRGHTIVCLANLHPAADGAAAADGDADGGGGVPQELDSWMFQTVGHTAVAAVAACIGAPLVRRATTGRSLHRGMHYPVHAAPAPAPAPAAATPSGAAATPSGARAATPPADTTATDTEDEVEDLAALLRDVQARYPSVRGVAVGAILSSYQRLRVEAVCARLGLVPLALLWQRRQDTLLTDMVRAGVDAVLVKVAAVGLAPAQLGRGLAELAPALRRAHARFGLNLCGEGGEYETMTLGAPGLYAPPHARVVVDAARVVVQSADALAPVAHWHITACHAARGSDEAGARAPARSGCAQALTGARPSLALPAQSLTAGSLVSQSVSPAEAAGVPAAAWQEGGAGGTVAVAGVTAYSTAAAAAADGEGSGDGDGGDGGDCAPRPTPAAEAARQLHAAMRAARAALAAGGCGLPDVFFVHLYVADMALFGAVNDAYAAYFGAHHPPSRSCVQVTLPPAGPSRPGGPPRPVLVMLDCVALRGSGAALADAAAPRPARATLHVASLSEWAPLCIGPYCQANAVNGVVWAAGSIGLDPPTMALVSPPPFSAGGGGGAGAGAAAALAGMALQCHQSLLNAARVLAALDASLSRSLSVVVYVAEDALRRLDAEASSPAGETSEGAAAAEPGRGGAWGASSRAALGLVDGMAAAWVAGAFGTALGDGAGGGGGNDGESDGTRSPPGSVGADGYGEGMWEEATPATADPCHEREFALGDAAHAAPPYLPRAALAALRRAVAEASSRDAGPVWRVPVLPPTVRAALPVRLLLVPALPRGAAVEVEVVAAQVPAGGGDDGDSGGLRAAWSGGSDHGASAVCVAHTAAAAAGATASVFVDARASAGVPSDAELAAAVRAGVDAVAAGAGLAAASIAHVRAYVPAGAGGGSPTLHGALQRALAAHAARADGGWPALTVVPAAPLAPGASGLGSGGDGSARVLLHFVAASACL